MQDTLEKTAQVNGVRISYMESGSGEKTVLFLHGFPFNKGMWKAQFAELQKDFRMIAMDLRGYGHSEKGNEKLSIDLFASDLLGFIESLGTKQAIVCGLSMGGYILMNAVARMPDKFRGIILADTQCIADSEEGKEKRYKTIEKINNEGLDKFAEGFVQNVLCKESLETKKDVVNQITSMINSANAQTVKDTLIALAERHETCNAIKSLQMPALIICGKEDTVTPLSQSELMHNALKGSVIREIDRAGHMSNMEQPDTFNKVLKEFVQGL